MSPKRKLFLITTIMFIVIGFGIMSVPCQEYSNFPTSKPVFISQVWPPPSANVPLGCYTRNVLKRLLTPYPNKKEPYAQIIKPESGISLTLNTHMLTNEMQDGAIPDNVNLYVDEKWAPLIYLDRGRGTSPDVIITDEGKAIIQPYTPIYYYFGSTLFLLPGEHTAKFIITKRNGEVLEYEWHFKITWR